MKEKDFNEILDVFVNGTELNLGLYPNTNIVEYGYSYIDNKLIFYLKGKERIDIIKKYVETNDLVHFYKYSSKGKLVNGEGNVKILETKEEKMNGLKYIKKQQTGLDNENNINENDLKDIFIFKVLVEKIIVW
jgi:hypothetical protein